MHVRRLGGGLVLADLADEAKALARQCLDQPLFFAGVADRAAGRVDPVEQRGFRDDAPMPDRGQQLVLADHAVAVPDQVNKKIEDLGLDGDQGSSPAQFAATCVEYTVLEKIAQGPILLGSRQLLTSVSRRCPKEKWREA